MSKPAPDLLPLVETLLDACRGEGDPRAQAARLLARLLDEQGTDEGAATFLPDWEPAADAPVDPLVGVCRQVLGGPQPDLERAAGALVHWLDAHRHHESPLADRYATAEGIGAGGMADVVVARDQLLRREVAIKRLRGDVAGARARFVAEAQVTGQLQHPNIVPVHDLGDDEQGRPFFVMKRVRGRSLREVLDAGQAGTLASRLDVFRKVCDAVAFAHSRGVLHRDLKPDNVMVGEFGEVQVMDWGLAKVLGVADEGDASRSIETDRTAAGQDRTLFGRIAGTPAYMAPEQAEGGGERIDERTDVYALGTLLYELISERRAFPGSAAEVLPRVREGKVEPPSARRGARRVPRELEAVILRALAFEPADRFQSVPELADEVAAFAEGRPLTTVRYNPLELFAKWLGRHRPAVRAGAATAAVALGLLAVSTVRHVDDIEAARDLARSEADRAEQEAKRATAARGEAVLRLAEGQVAVADAARRSDEVRRARDALLESRALFASQGAPTRSADLALAQLAQESAPAISEWTPGEGIAFSGGALSPSGDQLLVVDSAGQAWLYAVPTGRPLLTLAPPADGGTEVTPLFVGGEPRLLRPRGGVLELVDPVAGVVLARFDGQEGGIRRVVVAEGAGLGVTVGGTAAPAVLDLASGTATATALAEDMTVLDVSPDGRLVVGNRSYVDQTSLGVWDLPTGRLLRTVPGWQAARFSPDGRVLITASDGTLHAWDREGAALWSRPSRSVLRTGFSGDGRLLFTSSYQGRIEVLEAASGRLVGVLAGHEKAVSYLGADPRGAMLVSAGTDGRVRVWPVHSAAAGLPSGAGGAHGIEVSNDGRLLLVGPDDDPVRLFDADTGVLLRELDAGPRGVRQASFSLDGRRAATAGRDGTVRLFDLVSGEQLAVVRPGDEKVVALRFLDSADRVIVGGTDGRLRILDLRAATVEREFDRDETKAIWHIALAPDGRRVAASHMSGTDEEIWIRDLLSGELVLRLLGSEHRLFRGEWSPDGTRFAATNHLGRLHVWDGQTGAHLYGVDAHAGPGMATRWSPDGQLLVTVGYDWEVKLWDPSDASLLRSLPLHSAPVANVEVSPDGLSLWSTGGDSHVVRWRLDAPERLQTLDASRPDDPEYLASLARLLLAHGLSEQGQGLMERAAGAGADLSPLEPGLALLAAGRRDEAADALERARPDTPDGDSVYLDILLGALRGAGEQGVPGNQK